MGKATQHHNSDRMLCHLLDQLQESHAKLSKLLDKDEWASDGGPLHGAYDRLMRDQVRLYRNLGDVPTIYTVPALKAAASTALRDCNFNDLGHAGHLATLVLAAVIIGRVELAFSADNPLLGPLPADAPHPFMVPR